MDQEPMIVSMLEVPFVSAPTVSLVTCAKMAHRIHATMPRAKTMVDVPKQLQLVISIAIVFLDFLVDYVI